MAKRKWKKTFKRPHILKRKERPLFDHDPQKKRKTTREDSVRFVYRNSLNSPAKATKRSHGTKKIENRARNKRAKQARKINR